MEGIFNLSFYMIFFICEILSLLYLIQCVKGKDMIYRNAIFQKRKRNSKSVLVSSSVSKFVKLGI